MSVIKDYFAELSHGLGTAWNRFWFTPRDPYALAVLRVLTGLVALAFVASFSGDLVRWFGPDGILNTSTTYRLTGADQLRFSFHYSYLYLAETPLSLWILHVAGMVVVLAFTLGLWTRLTSVLALIVELAYVHRAPMLTAQLEPVLTMVTAYLCLAPTGRYLSLDAVLGRNKRLAQQRMIGADLHKRSLSANISTRLIQLHVAGFYLMIGLNMLAADVWWAGEGIWWLIARSESRLVDLTGLANWFLVVNVWTHAVVAYLLSFGLLAWHRLARPLLLVLGLIIWMSLAVITGLVLWCVMMCLAGLIFVEPDQFRRLIATRQSAAAE